MRGDRGVCAKHSRRIRVRTRIFDAKGENDEMVELRHRER